MHSSTSQAVAEEAGLSSQSEAVGQRCLERADKKQGSKGAGWQLQGPDRRPRVNFKCFFFSLVTLSFGNVFIIPLSTKWCLSTSKIVKFDFACIEDLLDALK